MANSRARRILTGAALLATLGVLALAGLFAFLWREHRSEVTLPPPTGSFAVGRVISDWTDDAAIDSLAPTPGTRRELLLWIWFPAAAPLEGSRA
jgi:hypothetical protein